MKSGTVRLRLPATSANLGPGFDSVALALATHLEIEARPSASFSINADGYAPELCSRLEDNLLLATYRETAAAHGIEQAPPLAITMHNHIPIGMGCGSSAATRLAGVALASSCCGLDWSRERILAEAVRLEGHPDNAVACWMGGFAVGAVCGGDEPAADGSSADSKVHAISIRPPGWHALIVIPPAPLATQASRRYLPEQYARRDVVHNLQRVALLTAAFASGRADVLACATSDLVHQPYRAEACPLLDRLLPLAGREGVLSVTLSGAGPAVLLLLSSRDDAARAKALVLTSAAELNIAEILDCALEPGPATHTWG